ncbi:glycosyl transferase [bacterium]|nr:MAG: glycosyl transferase [bacterium]
MHPYRGGIAHFLETMDRGLQARGHETLPVTFSRQYPDLLFPGKTQYETDPPENPIPARRWIDTIGPWSWWSAANHIAAWKPDAILYKYWMPFFAPAYGSILWRLRRQGVRGLAVVDNAIPHERRPLDIPLSRFFLRQCDGLLVMSDSVQQDLDRVGVSARRRRVEHPIYDIFGEGIDRSLAREQLGLAEGRPVLLFFGYVRRYKGLHVLLDAMPALLEQVPDALLLVCGEFYDAEAPYREQVQRLGIADSVDFHADYIPNEAVARYFSASDVVVQPYVTATQSGVAQIAYQFRRPSIITDVGGLAEVVPHERAGFVVPPEDPQSLASEIARFFLEQWAPRLEAGIEAERVKYSWDRLYEAMEELMEDGAE